MIFFFQQCESQVWLWGLSFVDVRNLLEKLPSFFLFWIHKIITFVSHTGLYGHPLLRISELDKLPIFCTLKVLGLSTKSPFAQILFVCGTTMFATAIVREQSS